MFQNVHLKVLKDQLRRFIISYIEQQRKIKQTQASFKKPLNFAKEICLSPLKNKILVKNNLNICLHSFLRFNFFQPRIPSIAPAKDLIIRQRSKMNL